MTLGALTIAAERPGALARFYSTLLNWPYIREEAPAPGDPPGSGYALVCPPDGVAAPALNFEYDRNYRRPVWPTEAGRQIPTIHLDLGVDDLDVGVAWAIECGAQAAEFQPNPDAHRVMIDPQGHPFCLCR
jgi:hypothetical protein